MSEDISFANPTPFAARGGETLYREICQACHMPYGNGAVGAARYPSLVHNERLAASGYPIAIILGGRRAMPGFGAYLTDDQVASLVQYVRTHFGNEYRDPVAAADVAQVRQSLR